MAYLNELKVEDWKRMQNVIDTSFTLMELTNFAEKTYPDIFNSIPVFGASKNSYIHDLLQAAQRRGKLDNLLVSIAKENPNRSDLRTLYLSLTTKPGWEEPVETQGLDIKSSLEKLTAAGNPFVDPILFADWLMNISRQVCAIKCGSSVGTGFLIAPNLIMTCFHVVEDTSTNEVADSTQIRVRFDYYRKFLGDNPMYDEGEWLELDPQWEIPHSKYSQQADVNLIGNPNENELDFAILKLKDAVGSRVPTGDEGSSKRGWIDLSANPMLPQAGEPMYIVQHPGVPPTDQPPPQNPLKITDHFPGFDGFNSNKTRIAYKISTRPGSSGSPVFNGQFKAVALHHNRGDIHPSADPNLAKNNRGIPLGKIRDALEPSVRAMLEP